MEPFQQFRGRHGTPGPQSLEQRVEGAGRIPGLGDPVRVQQQLVAGAERVGVDAVGIPDEHAEVQRWTRLPLVQLAHVAGADEQRRRMAAVEETDDPLVLGDLGEDGRDEPLAEFGPAQPVGPPGHADVHPVHQGAQVGFVVRGLAERAKHRRRGLHREQPLAAHVADEQAYPVRGGHGLEEVAADAGLRRGGQVEALQQQVPDPVRNRSEQDALRDLGHEADVGQGAFPTDPVRRQDRAQGTHQGRAHVGGHIVPFPDVADGAPRTAGGSGQQKFQTDGEDGSDGHDDGRVREGGHQGQRDQYEADRPLHRGDRFDQQHTGDVQDR